MAKAKTNSLLDNISGKLDKTENTYLRVRYGRQEVCHRNDDKPIRATQNMKNTRSNYGKICKIASIINKNPQLAASFLARYNKLPEESRPQILYRSIVSDLSADPTLLAQYEYLLTN